MSMNWMGCLTASIIVTYSMLQVEKQMNLLALHNYTLPLPRADISVGLHQHDL